MEATPARSDRVLVALGVPEEPAFDVTPLDPILRGAASYLEKFQTLENALTAAREVYRLSRIEVDQETRLIRLKDDAFVVLFEGEYERRLRLDQIEAALEHTRVHAAVFNSVLEAGLGRIPDSKSRQERVEAHSSSLIFDGPRERVESLLLTCAHIIRESERGDLYQEAMRFLASNDHLVASEQLLSGFLSAAQCSPEASAHLYGLAGAIQRDLERAD